MTRNDLTNHLLNAAIVASVMLAIALYAYYDWQPADPGPPETEMLVPGPVAPQPKIEDHVAAVMRQENATFTTASPGGGTMTEDTNGTVRFPQPPESVFYRYGGGTIEYVPKDYCPTWDALRRAGVEVICTNAFGEVPRVNYWPQDMPMACSRIKKVVIHDKRIEVERK